MSFLLAFLLVFSWMFFLAQEAKATSLVPLGNLTKGQVVTLKRADGTIIGTAMVVTPGTKPYLVMIGDNFETSAYGHGPNLPTDVQPTTVKGNTTNRLNTNNPGYTTVSNETSVPSKVQFNSLTK